MECLIRRRSNRRRRERELASDVWGLGLVGVVKKMKRLFCGIFVLFSIYCFFFFNPICSVGLEIGLGISIGPCSS